jgi:Mn-dependent DtxR family transcriptional regulator
MTNDVVRISDISNMLHVKPSSATKMVQTLTSHGYLTSVKYGFIFLTEKGEKQGKYLLYRHDVINKFLCSVNHSKNELEQAEKIEHFLNVKTVKNLDILVQKLLKESGGRKKDSE